MILNYDFTYYKSTKSQEKIFFYNKMSTTEDPKIQKSTKLQENIFLCYKILTTEDPKMVNEVNKCKNTPVRF